MFRFFRQLRQRLVNENPVDPSAQAGRLSKYLFYLFGEVFIVIVGILMALQVDAWNTDRENRQEAQEFLKRLKGEFLANRNQLVDKINMRKEALKSARELLLIADGKTVRVTSSRVDSLLAVALPVYTFDPSLGVLNQLTSTDKLTLISSKALNDKLSIWNSMIQDFKEDENMYNSYNHNHFRPYLYKNYNTRNVINSRIRNRVINPILLSSPELVNTEIGFSNKHVNWEVLQSSLEFENYLAFTISWLSLINTQSQGILNYIDSVIELIDGELKEE
ncbi:MAG: DUF6090 family protein [Robiginitalea sp.]|jgi:hypothetical protein